MRSCAQRQRHRSHFMYETKKIKEFQVSPIYIHIAEPLNHLKRYVVTVQSSPACQITPRLSFGQESRMPNCPWVMFGGG